VEALEEFRKEYEDAILEVKWSQFIFSRQLNRLKKYCASLNIKMFGDLPFYVCHDSVDVWANRELFSLDEKGNIRFVAGVPPDYFNASGQLWGMPVFNWEALRESNYHWWVMRIRKNLEFYDLLRMDHFRAFADYWEVPAGEETAVNGSWRKGPGSSLFEVLEREFKALPFVAEDLGDINEDVHHLRDEFRLPGMKVLQFALNGSIAESLYSPHNFESDNFIVYSGTHDNNTTRGWYRKDVDKANRKELEKYIGHSLRERTIHEDIIRLAYTSIGKIAIIPMQDVLGLSERARMNIPGDVQKNWVWRMLPDEFSPEVELFMRRITRISNRI
jgi:4-alpha-glucanotransferase